MDTETRQIHNFLAGDLFDRHYRLLEHVGSGGFADVWKAKDELVDTIVALKIYTRLDKEGISELAREYRDMRGIKHPNLLTGNHFDASGNIPYLEMDYCDGGSLYGKMGKMSSEELRHVLRDIAGGLAYLHSEGIVHQDIKPENILYDTKKNRYLLSDFGISGKSRTRLSHSVNKANMTLSMTEAYAPPEKFSGNLADIEPDTKGDIFSLGMTMFELAVGRLPFTPPMATGREMFYREEKGVPLRLDYSHIKDLQLCKIVEGCTEYGKTERLTAEQVLAMLPDPEQSKKTGSSRPPTKEIKVSGSGQQGTTTGQSGTSGTNPPSQLPLKWIYIVGSIIGVALLLAIIVQFCFRSPLDSISVPTQTILNISSNPSKASVYINGVYKGITPLSLKDQQPGLRIISMSADGYEWLEQTIEIKSGVPNTCHANLKKK